VRVHVLVVGKDLDLAPIGDGREARRPGVGVEAECDSLDFLALRTQRSLDVLDDKKAKVLTLGWGLVVGREVLREYAAALDVGEACPNHAMIVDPDIADIRHAGIHQRPVHRHAVAHGVLRPSCDRHTAGEQGIVVGPCLVDWIVEACTRVMDHVVAAEPAIFRGKDHRLGHRIDAARDGDEDFFRSARLTFVAAHFGSRLLKGQKWREFGAVLPCRLHAAPRGEEELNIRLVRIQARRAEAGNGRRRVHDHIARLIERNVSLLSAERTSRQQSDARYEPPGGIMHDAASFTR
jgi:hypothetical protein